MSRWVNIQSNKHVQVVLLIAICLLATALRFFKLGEWSFWFDEIFTVNRATIHYHDLGQSLLRLPQQVWLPISVLLTGQTLTIFGVSEWTARLIPAIIGIITIPILYFPIRHFLGVGVALISALLLAVAPWHLYWSQNARFYTSLMLFYTLALFAFFFALERDRPVYILVGFFFLFLATSERMFALFIVPVMVVYLLLLWLLPFEKPAGFRFRNLVLMGLLPLAIFVIVEVFSFLSIGRGRFLDESFLADIGWFTLYRIDDPLRLGIFIGFKIGIPMILISLCGAFYLLQRRERVGLLLVSSAILPIVLLLLLNPFVFTKDRYVFLTLTSWIILAAVAVIAMFRGIDRSHAVFAVGVLAILVVTAASSNLLYYTVNHGDRGEWREIFTIIADKSEEGDLYVSAWPELGEYYLDAEVLPWLEVDVPELVERKQRIWFILDSETQFGNQSRNWVVFNTQLKEVNHLRTLEDLSIYLYLFDPAQTASENEESS